MGGAKVECYVMRVMTHRKTSQKEATKLSDEDISELAKIFELLIKMDKKNIQEGKYTRESTMQTQTSPSP